MINIETEGKKKSPVKIIIFLIIAFGILLLFKSEDYVYTDFTYKCIKKDNNPERDIYNQENEKAYLSCINDELAKKPTLTKKYEYDIDTIVKKLNQELEAKKKCGDLKLRDKLLETTPPPWYINERVESCDSYGKIKCIQFFGVCIFKIVPSL